MIQGVQELLQIDQAFLHRLFETNPNALLELRQLEINRYLLGKNILAIDNYARYQVSSVFDIKNLARSVEVIAKLLNFKQPSLDSFCLCFIE